MQPSMEKDRALSRDAQHLEFRAESKKVQLRYMSAILMVIGIASRLHFQSHILHHWDSVNFALALEHFDVRLHQPHPPGTFVLYILFGRLFNLYFDDGNRSLVWASMVVTGFAVVIIFLLIDAWADRQHALIISLVMITSPLIWFQGEVALSYMPEFFWVLLIVYVLAKNKDVSKTSLFASAFLIGLAGGIRPNTPFFLFPLWLFILIRGFRARAYSLKDALTAIGLIAFGVLIWAVPMINMSGGIDGYRGMLNWWRKQHVESSATTRGITLHLFRLSVFVFYALGAALLPVICIALKDWRILKEKLSRDWRAQILAVWILPALMYYVFVHVQQSGHTFTIMPAIIILAGFSVVRFGRFLNHYIRHALPILASVIIASNVLFFTFGPADIFGASRVTLTAPTRVAITEYDDYVLIRLDAIRKHFSPESTIILADARNFRIPDYYLREYQKTSLSYQLGEEFITLPDSVHTLVLFDSGMANQFSTDSTLQTLPLSHGGSLRYISWGDNQSAKLSRHSLKIQ